MMNVSHETHDEWSIYRISVHHHDEWRMCNYDECSMVNLMVIATYESYDEWNMCTHDEVCEPFQKAESLWEHGLP